MLVGSGQPVEIVRSIRDVQGTPFDPALLPVASVTAVLTLDGPDPTGTVIDGGGPAPSTACTVSKVDQGLYAARLPSSVLTSVATLRLDWSWTDTEPVTGRDSVEVTSVPVCSVQDVSNLPGSGSRNVPLWKQLAAISQATRAFESATNTEFSPRIALGFGVVTGLPSTYVAGMPEPPEDVTRAVAILASSLMTDGPWDDRGYAVGDEGGTMRLLTAGVGRTMFSIPEVEATARRYRQPVFA